MGVDINLVVEQRRSDGWRLVRPRYGRVWYDARNVRVFTMLAGQPIGHPSISPCVAVAPPRGWPDDLSAEARRELGDPWFDIGDREVTDDAAAPEDDDAFGDSWLDVADFVAFDWDQSVEWTFEVGLDGPPVEITDDVRSAVAEYVRLHGWAPPGWGICRSGGAFELTIERSCRDLAGNFLAVVDEMRALAGADPSSVRCVFRFSY